MGYFRDAASNGPPPNLSDTNYAFWAHVIAAIASLCTAGLVVPLLAPFMVLMFTPSRHPFLMFHLNQAVFFQLLIHIVQIVLATVLWFVAFVTCGLGLPLLAFLVFPWLASLIVPVMYAFRARNGEWALTPFVGETIFQMQRPLFV